MPRTAQVTQFNRGKRYNRGGYNNRVSSAKRCLQHAALSASQRGQLAIHPGNSQRSSSSLFSALLVQPPISPRYRVSNHNRTNATDPAAIKRPKTRVVLVTDGRTSRLSRTDAVRVWGSPWDRREPPENWVVGCETRGGKKSLTLSTFNLPQFTQMHSKIFFTFTMKPEGTIGW